MLGFIIVGHGNFSEGISSSLTLIIGEQEKYKSITFDALVNPDELTNKIEAAIYEIQDDGIIIFTDLKGGYPYQAAVTVASKFDNIEVLTGTNLAMLLEACILRQREESVEMVYKLIETGKSQIERFDFDQLKNIQNQDSFDDGI